MSYIYSTRPIIITVFFEALNNILTWKYRGDTINVSNDVFLHFQFVNFVAVDPIAGVINLMISKILEPGPVFEVKQMTHNMHSYYMITLYEPTSFVRLLPTFDIINFLPTKYTSIDRIYNLYPYIYQYVPKNQLFTNKNNYEDDDEDLYDDKPLRIIEYRDRKTSKKKVSKKKSSKKKVSKKKTSKKKTSKKKSSLK